MAGILTNHQLKALDIDNHLALTANAGSGKTFVLKKRFVEILMQDKGNIRNIAAITFTEKAASDLYKKIAEEIEFRLATETEKENIRNLERFQRQLVSANISTIHSFCINILREFPVEAGLDANFIPIDARLSDELIEISVEEAIKNSFYNEKLEKDLKSLIRIFGSKSLFAGQLISLIKNRKNVLALEEEIYRNSEVAIADFFYSTTIEYFNKIFQPDKEKIVKSFERIVNELRGIEAKRGYAEEIDGILEKINGQEKVDEILKSFAELADFCLTKSTDKFYSKIFPKEFFVKYEDQFDEIRNYIVDVLNFNIPENHKEIEIELARFGKSILNIFNAAIEIYTQKKQENGYLDFEDILLFTRKIINNDYVRKSLSEKFSYIMVDEYQDTNEIQYRIFLPILEDLKKGNLFVVGDEKQSIYMFRDAELEVYDKTKQEIIRTGEKGRLLNLPDSFRMAPNLCLFINEVFKNLFTQQNNLFNEVSYNELVCARENSFDGRVELLMPTDVEEETQDEAQLVAQRIVRLVKEENVKLKDIAVLCRKRKYFSELDKEFLKTGISYTILGGKGFYQRQCIYDVYNYFSFLIDNNNSAALVGVLRSPFFNISDSEIFEISLTVKDSFWEKLKVFSTNNSRYENIVKTISDNVKLTKNSPASEILRKILNESDFLPVLSSKPNGDQEIANINKLLSLTVKFSSEKFKNLYDYVDFLKTSINKMEDESQAAISDESNSVTLMTIHQSKGLEYKAVFIYKGDEKLDLPSVRKKSIYVDKNFGILTKVPVNNDYFSDYLSAPIVGVYDYVHKRKSLAEFKRLFYVAATRTEDYLFISTSCNNVTSNTNSFIGLLATALNCDFTGTSMSLKGSLTFIRKNLEKYDEFNKNIEFEIPITRELVEEKLNDKSIETDKAEYEISISELEDNTKGEIISASKVAIFSQCPLKYHLIYDLGFSKILSQNKNYLEDKNRLRGDFEYAPKEDKLSEKDSGSFEIGSSYSAIRGSIIHKILEYEVPIDNLVNFIDLNLNIENEKNLVDNGFSETLKSEVFEEIKGFYNSAIYKELSQAKDYKNEFEVYAKEDDYFLYGIIDKVIFEKDRIHIIDYKTDKIEESEVEKRGESYLPQLKFYSYILSRLFPGIEKYDLRLVFLAQPGKRVVSKLDKNEANHFGERIKHIAYEIREGKFHKNLDHCSRCTFEIKGKCIKE